MVFGNFFKIAPVYCYLFERIQNNGPLGKWVYKLAGIVFRTSA
jgi:hypothetical protein